MVPEAVGHRSRFRRDSIMKSLNALSDNPNFQKTSLYNAFKKRPLGFVDAGAAGGVHLLVMPVASLVHCTCFEPDTKAYEKLIRHFQTNDVFAKFTLFDKALGKEEADATLYLTVSPVNSSLLRPSRILVDRYGIKGFNLERETQVRTEPLDRIVFKNNKSGERPGEFIKLDCQGAEYDILQGGARTLNEQCVALWCEVEFFKMYEDQKTFSELDLFLNEKGFRLYGLYPNYISTKGLDRRLFETEERIIWADALYFKDPLAEANRGKTFTERDVDVLLMTAMLTGYYDYALEIIASFRNSDPGKDLLVDLVMELAADGKKAFMSDLMKLMKDCRISTGNAYLLTKKFMDDHASNSNIDFINVEE
jgi:FkbM family methyltransferase